MLFIQKYNIEKLFQKLLQIARKRYIIYSVIPLFVGGDFDVKK